MICFIEPELEPAFLHALSFDIVAGARIFSLYSMYGIASRELMLWVQLYNKSNPTAALVGYGSVLHICASEKADISELEEFISFMGFKTVYSSPVICACFNSASYRNVKVMVFSQKRASRHNYTINVTDSPRLFDVYKLLCECDDDFAGHTDCESWYAHTSLLLRRGLGYCFGIYRDGVLSSTAGIYAMSQTHAIIGGVATHPDYSGLGYAGTLVSKLVDIATDCGRVPVVLTDSEYLSGWYKSIGFILFGEMCELYL